MSLPCLSRIICHYLILERNSAWWYQLFSAKLGKKSKTESTEEVAVIVME